MFEKNLAIFEDYEEPSYKNNNSPIIKQEPEHEVILEKP